MRGNLWLLAIGAVPAIVNVIPAFASSAGVIWGP